MTREGLEFIAVDAALQEIFRVVERGASCSSAAAAGIGSGSGETAKRDLFLLVRVRHLSKVRQGKVTSGDSVGRGCCCRGGGGGHVQRVLRGPGRGKRSGATSTLSDEALHSWNMNVHFVGQGLP